MDTLIIVVLGLSSVANAVGTVALGRILWFHVHDEDVHLPLRDRN